MSTEVPSQKSVGLNPGAFKGDFHMESLFKYTFAIIILWHSWGDSSPGFESRLRQDFFSFQLSLRTVLRLNPFTVVLSNGFHICS